MVSTRGRGRHESNNGNGKSAERNLLNGRGLLALIRQRSREQQAVLLEVALEGDYRRPTCASCGTKMVERTPKGGGKAFWGCQNYPRCWKTMPMRSVDPRPETAPRARHAAKVDSSLLPPPERQT